ncbi:MAG: lipid-A-disaccharide synthase [Cyanophyceae cyanobacterium]
MAGESVQDILILSNGPGEVSTWVRPVVRSLRQIHHTQARQTQAQQTQTQQTPKNQSNQSNQSSLKNQSNPNTKLRISVVLSPCAHAMGTEQRVLESFPEVDRVQGPEHFWRFLLGGKTAENWTWSDRGVVLFLGGDQFFSVLIGKRLGYRILTYAEQEVRWLSWIDGVGTARSTVTTRSNPKVRLVGDLMVDAARSPLPDALTEPQLLQLTESPQPKNNSNSFEGLPKPQWVGLLPGSKAAKLMQGVPLMSATAETLARSHPHVRCIIPVAPTLSLAELCRYGDRRHNPILGSLGNVATRLVRSNDHTLPYLETSGGVKIYLWERSPAYDLLQHCTVCLTTVGANTAELAAIAVPMVVILPTQQLDAMRAWDGIPGLLAQLPGVGSLVARIVNQQTLKRLGLLSWPNIWAQEAIVPELGGPLTASYIAGALQPWLDDPDKNRHLRDRLQKICGPLGAAENLARWAQSLL